MIAELAGFKENMADLPPQAFEKYIHMPGALPEERKRTAHWTAIKVFVDTFIAMSPDSARIPHTM